MLGWAAKGGYLVVAGLARPQEGPLERPVSVGSLLVGGPGPEGTASVLADEKEPDLVSGGVPERGSVGLPTGDKDPLTNEKAMNTPGPNGLELDRPRGFHLSAY